MARPRQNPYGQTGKSMSQRKSKEFFAELKDWSERKHQLLNMYLSAASKIMGSTWKRVVYLDGFAGRGTYGDGTTSLPGPPVKAAQLAQTCLDGGKAYSLRCINIEEDPQHFAELCASTSPFGGLVLNLPGTFLANTDRILQELGGQAGICCLDPFGIKGIDWSAVERLIRRPNVTDLWIRFDHQTVRRLSGFFESGDPRGPKKLDNLFRVYGITDPVELQQRLAGATPEERVEKALRLYMERLGSTYYHARGEGYAAAYCIRATTGRVKYHMVFATGHPKGLTLANDVAFTVEETYQTKVREHKDNQPHQLPMFVEEPTPQGIFDAVVQQLKATIWKLYRGRVESRINIYVGVLASEEEGEEWFGKIKSSHLTHALNAMKTEGSIIQTNGPSSKDHTRFTFRT